MQLRPMDLKMGSFAGVRPRLGRSVVGGLVEAILAMDATGRYIYSVYSTRKQGDLHVGV